MAKRRPSGDGMVRKREDGRWEGRIVVGHKENGDSIFQYVHAPTQKALLPKLHQNIELFRDVELCEDSRMTLAQRLYANLKKEGRVHEHPEHGCRLSANTVRRIHTMLHRAMADAVRAHVIPRNPADGVTLPKVDAASKRVLTDRELDEFMDAIKADPLWHDFFYTELTTGLRRGEICGLMWSDFDERGGTLKISRTLRREKGGRLVAGDTKTCAGTRKIVLPPSTAELLKARKKKSFSPWIFHDPLRPEAPVDPNSAYWRLKKFLADAGLPNIRFHDLRHTFSTISLEHGMDVKTLSTIIGHVSSSTTLNVYAHVTDEMRRTAAVKIDQGIGKADPRAEAGAAPRKPAPSIFQAQKGQRRKAGTGCVSRITETLWEGRYSPIWPDGKKRPRNIYAHSEEECERLLADLIAGMKAEIAAEKQRIREEARAG